MEDPGIVKIAEKIREGGGDESILGKEQFRLVATGDKRKPMLVRVVTGKREK